MTGEWKQKRLSYFSASRQRQLSGARGFLNLAPMMDVMFNLLIFFLVATTFAMPEGTFLARLPKRVGLSADLAVPVVPIRVLLQAREDRTRIFVSCSASGAASSQAVPVADYEQLYGQLVQLQGGAGFDRDTPVVLASQDGVDWQDVMQAYNAAIRAGFKKIVFSQW